MILVTGGAGYIGSHVVRDLLEKSYEVAVLDNLSTGHRYTLPQNVPFYEVDLLDQEALTRAVKETAPEAVLHFAAKSIVPASIKDPLNTFSPNLTGTMHLLKAMEEAGTKALVFSSTAAVYGEPRAVPIMESHPTEPTNPYGESKLFIEKILARLAGDEGSGNLRYISLRYFNAAGAYPDGSLGEDHTPETHLIPKILNAASGKEELNVYGSDYPTTDGTPMRDYIHVCDLASAHTLALETLLKGHKKQALYNLGNEQGYTVLEVIKRAEEITGKKISYRIGPRRAGDPSVLVAGSELIKRELGWSPNYSNLETIIESAWRWHNRKHRQ